MSNGRKDLYSGIAFLLFAGFLYVQSFAIKMTTSDSLGPQFFPRLVVVCMLVLAAAVIVKAVALIHKENEAGSNGQAKDKKIPWNIPLLLTIALLVGYFLLIETVGYVVLTAAYLFCQMTILLPDGAVKNKKYLIPIVLTSVLIPSGIYFVFYRIFMIFLPAGILG